MMKTKRILWGVVLVAFGILFGLDVVDVIDMKDLFEGWWTFFIIIPSIVSIITDREKIWGITGLFTGSVLFLSCQDIIEDSAVIKLIIPFVIVLIGLKLIFKDLFNKEAQTAKKKIAESGENVKEYAATFSGQDVDFSGEVFTSAKVNAIFGGMKCDLRNAVISDGAVLDVSAVFGGVDVLVPPDVNVKISSTSIFGGVSDKRNAKPVSGAVTLLITGVCLFGGVDIK